MPIRRWGRNWQAFLQKHSHADNQIYAWNATKGPRIGFPEGESKKRKVTIGRLKGNMAEYFI